MNLNKQRIIRWKIYLDRARMYIMYINFFLIVTVFIRSLKEIEIGRLMNDHMAISIPIMILLLLIVSLVLGYFDTKLGIRSEEARNIASHNPIMMEILQKVREVHEKQVELEKEIEKKEP